MTTVRWPAVARGALMGLVVIAPVAVLFTILDRAVTDFPDSGWAPLFAVAILAAYVAAGFGAGRVVPEAPLTNGALAGLGALAAWLPLRIAIWALRGNEHGLFSGHAPVFTASRLLGQAVFAVAFGIVGALLGARSARATTPTRRD